MPMSLFIERLRSRGQECRRVGPTFTVQHTPWEKRPEQKIETQLRHVRLVNRTTSKPAEERPLQNLMLSSAEKEGRKEEEIGFQRPVNHDGYIRANSGEQKGKK